MEIHVSAMEIYNDSLKCLLTGKSGLEIRCARDTVEVVGQRHVQVTTVTQAMSVMHESTAARTR